MPLILFFFASPCIYSPLTGIADNAFAKGGVSGDHLVRCYLSILYAIPGAGYSLEYPY